MFFFLSVDFTVNEGAGLVLYFCDQGVDLFVIKRAFPARFRDSRTHFFPAERFSGVIAFDDLDESLFEPFVGSVSVVAGQALTPAPDGETIRTGPGVDDAVVVATTNRTSHERTSHRAGTSGGKSAKTKD